MDAGWGDPRHPGEVDALGGGPGVQFYVDETRPLLQGARLTAWELHRDGIPVEVITDNAELEAAGRIGAIKSLEMLRSICSHVGCLVLPAPVSVANVQKVFAADGTVLDAEVEKSVRGLASTVLDYLNRHVCPLVTLEAMAREGTAV